MSHFLKNPITFFIVAIAIATTLFVFNLPFTPASGWGGHDSESYIKVSEGRIGEVVRPFSSRILFPFLAGWLSEGLFHDTTTAFLFISSLSLIGVLALSGVILRNEIKWPIFLVPLFLLPYFSETLREFFPPDLFYTFLTALFFFLLYKEKEWFALVVLFLLFLTRESTLLLSMLFIGFSFMRGKRWLAVVAIAISILAIVVTGIAGSSGMQNAYNIGGSAYLALKLPYNFIVNALGLRLWTNVFTFCEPVWKSTLPAIDLLGNIREVGFCGFDATFPLGTLATLLSVFGIMPLVLLFALPKNRKSYYEMPFWLFLALVYGILHYFVGVVAGTGVFRIVGYGWPAFLLAVPFLMKNKFALDKKSLIWLSLLQLFTAWLPLFVIRYASTTVGSLLFILFFVCIAYVCAFRILKGQKIAVAF